MGLSEQQLRRSLDALVGIEPAFAPALERAELCAAAHPGAGLWLACYARSSGNR